jgi:Spy/CpxP family protein refolding chaperone
MRQSGWILGPILLMLLIHLIMGVMPAVAQDFDELPPGARFAAGNLSVQEVIQANEPVEHLKQFFAGENLRLSKEQERKIEGIVGAQRRELQAVLANLPKDGDAATVSRKLNQEYVGQVNAVLTPDQQSAWRHYRIEQLRLRGGFPALKGILESANLPMTADQEKSIAKIFENFAARQAHLVESNPGPAVAEVDRLVVAEFNRVVALLTPEQRQALLASRPRRPSGAVPPRISSR